RAEPFVRDPGVWPHQNAALRELVMKRQEAVFQPGTFDLDAKILEANLQELVVGQRGPGKFPAWHGALNLDDAGRWCHGTPQATTRKRAGANGVPEPQWRTLLHAVFAVGFGCRRHRSLLPI